MRIALNEDNKPKPSMTPVIDVVFNLLVFFLLASQFARVERDQDIVVPDMSYLPALSAMPAGLVVNVSESGTYTVLGQTVDLAGLDTMIARAASVNEVQTVVIRCDGRARVRAQADVMDLCNRHKVRIAVTVSEKQN